MIEEREVITLFLGVFAAVLARQNIRSLVHLPAVRVLLATGMVLLCGFVVSILESLFWADGFNVLEHAAYGSSSLLLAVWVWLAFARDRERAQPDV